MKNLLEKLVKNTNYQEYLKRMTLSLSNTGKGLIPWFVPAEAKTILDVGCGNGILMKTISELMPDKRIYGIDINENAVAACQQEGLSVSKAGIENAGDLRVTFDCVIFSSVLHEISSYDPVKPYSWEPIAAALSAAKKVLRPGGRVIIRDGVACDDSRSVTIRFRNKSDTDWILKFQKDYPANPVYYSVVSSDSILLSAEMAKEFLYTYTWGEKSWKREVIEKFGILSVSGWQKVLRSSGYRISTLMTSAEEYRQYLAQKIVMNPNVSEIFEQATILITAEKE